MYSTSNFFTINMFDRAPFKVVFPEAMTAADFTNLIYKGMDMAELVMFNEVYPEKDTIVRALSVPSDDLTHNGFRVTVIDWENIPNPEVRNNYRQILEKCVNTPTT